MANFAKMAILALLMLAASLVLGPAGLAGIDPALAPPASRWCC